MADAPSRSDGFAVKVDFERIMETISARIYDNQYAFLRENAQNAIDAIRIQAARDRLPTDDPRYRIEIKIQGNECTIQDNGIGMTKEELENNFWTMGASGKTTQEARSAGCIGVFGIGGFANFGVCDTLEVISRSGTCDFAHHTSLSKSEFSSDRFGLPTVRYRKTQVLATRGTIVKGTSMTPFDTAGLANYIKEFVWHVNEAVYVQGHLLSQHKLQPFKENYRELTRLTNREASGINVQCQFFSDQGHNLAVTVSNIKVGNQIVACEGYLRLIHGAVNVYKRGFRICAVNISSRIGVSGDFDCDILKPTAGRDTLDSESLNILNRLFATVETAALPIILSTAELLENHIRLVPLFISQGHVEKLGLLPVKTLGNREVSLAELREAAKKGARIFYTSTGRSNSATEVMQARGHFIVSLSANQQRRSAEIAYLTRFCKAEQFDNLIECLEPYTTLDEFDRAVLSELDYALRKLFKTTQYRFIAGQLTLDVPIYWSSKKESGATIVYVDTRHGEFQKLRALGFSALFWSMIEAFCIEYLGDTLKRNSPKFFGTGAIDLDAYSKAHAELWELLSSDIEISRIRAPDGDPGVHRNISNVDVVHVADVVRITITRATGVTESVDVGESEDKQPESKQPESKPPPKLLNIIDETNTTGLTGYYLRIPQSATAAFGDIIRTMPSCFIVWFANRITWHASDLNSTSFLFDITLDDLIKDESGSLAHGAEELGPARIQTYNGQIYFFIPGSVQKHLVPRSNSQPVKIEIRHELLDLAKPRSWTSKQAKQSN